MEIRSGFSSSKWPCKEKERSAGGQTAVVSFGMSKRYMSKCVQRYMSKMTDFPLGQLDSAEDSQLELS